MAEKVNISKKFYTNFTQKMVKGRGVMVKKCSVSKGFRFFESEKSSSLRTKRSGVRIPSAVPENS